MENQADNENYWHRSSKKGFSFDDEDDDNKPSTSKKNVSAKTTNVTEASFENTSPLDNALTLNSVISDETLQFILRNQRMDDTDSYVYKGSNPAEELKFLRRKIQTVIGPPSVKETVHKLILGKIVSLENFKALEEKTELLDELIKLNVGDAIVHVLLFCKRTLTASKFHEVLLARPRALRQYISFLRDANYMDEAMEILHLSGKTDEAAVLEFQLAMASDDLSTRKAKLKNLIDKYNFDNFNTIVPIYQQVFADTLKTLEFVEKYRHDLDNEIDMNSTPVEILYACCKKYANWKETDLKSPLSPYRVAADLHISPTLFEWTAFNERAQAQAYGDLECIFEKQSSWHPLKSKQFHMNFSIETAVERLHELEAPPAVLYLFLSKMKDDDEKLELAKSVNCTKAVIDALAGKKDAEQLAALMATLEERSEEHFYCDKAIKALQTKRWSTMDKLKL